ncbi:uncharacterized protein L201_008061 [Kwoniella dendrophila CBS 6074]|uniref:NAD(P)-binding domain-containing protein n=1 Tax=Kwoniella dendrophila CBS 6074 TaxID=1295534 RepID=A0AAX4K646_9TREE
MATPSPITLVGATGLTGSFTLKSILSSSHPSNLTILTRRSLPFQTPSPGNPQTKLTTRLYENLFQAPKDGQKISESNGVYISCLGTTRADAGGTANQEKLDLDLNRDLAKKAREDGADTMILVSSGGASHTSRFFYMRIKGQLEEDVKAMGFNRVIILRPGALIGHRADGRKGQWFMNSLFTPLKTLGISFNSATYGEDVGACIAELVANPPEEKLLTISDDKIVEYANKFRKSNPNSSSSS